MMYHGGAALTLMGRHAMVLEIEDGAKLRPAAAARSVAVATAHRWWVRWREATPGDRASLACARSLQRPAAQSDDVVDGRPGAHLRGARAHRLGPPVDRLGGRPPALHGAALLGARPRGHR